MNSGPSQVQLRVGSDLFSCCISVNLVAGGRVLRVLGRVRPIDKLALANTQRREMKIV